MSRIINIGIEAIAASIFLLPILFIEHKFIFKSTKQTIYYFVFAFYLSALFAAVGIPRVNYLRFDITLNIIPILPIVNDLNNSILNIILFIPFGLALPCLWKRCDSLKQTALYGLLLSVLVEFLQIFTYRATDVNDLITNTLGTVLGYLVWKLVFTKQNFIVPTKNHNHFYIVSLTAFFVMFFMQPFLLS